MTEFNPLKNIDSTDNAQLSQWLTNVQTIYQNNETEHFAAILTDLTSLNSLTNIDPDFLANQNGTINNLKKQIEFVVNNLTERENPQQLLEDSKSRRISVTPQITKSKRPVSKRNLSNTSFFPSKIDNFVISVEKITKSINKYLGKVVIEWNNILINGTDASLHQANIPLMKNILPLIEQSLITNTSEGFQTLFTTWNNDYPQWDDRARWDLKKLSLYLKKYEANESKKEQENSNLNNLKVKEQEIKIKELATKLTLAQQEAQENVESLKQFKELHDKLLKETKENTARDYQELYQNHIDSQNEIEFTEFAEKHYKMVSRNKHNEIKKELLKSRKENETLKEQKEELQVNNAQLKSDINIYQEKAERAERKTDNFNNLCGSYIEESSELTNQLERERQKNAILEKRLKDLEAQLAKKNNPQAIVHSDLEDSDLNLSDLDSEVESIGGESENEDNSANEGEITTEEAEMTSNNSSTPTSPQLNGENSLQLAIHDNNSQTSLKSSINERDELLLSDNEEVTEIKSNNAEGSDNEQLTDQIEVPANQLKLS